MLGRRAFLPQWRSVVRHRNGSYPLIILGPLPRSRAELRSQTSRLRSFTFSSTCLKAVVNLPSLPNLRPDASHTDIDSFLSYASRTELDPTSKVYVGTHYEYTVLSLLSNTYQFQLTRIAGANDRGIDLLGYWHLPSSPSPLRVIIQCKVLSRLQPRVVRELEGSFPGAPAGWNDERDTLACLVGTGTATKGIRDAIGSSRVGIVWICVTQDGVVQQMLWNQRAREMGLEGVDVVLRHQRDGAGKELRLMWDRKIIPKGGPRAGGQRKEAGG